MPVLLRLRLLTVLLLLTVHGRITHGVDVDPQDPVSRAKRLAGQGSFDEAVGLVVAHQEELSYRDARGLNELGNTLVSNGRINDARHTYELAVMLSPGYVAAAHNLEAINRDFPLDGPIPMNRSALPTASVYDDVSGREPVLVQGGLGPSFQSDLWQPSALAEQFGDYEVAGLFPNGLATYADAQAGLLDNLDHVIEELVSHPDKPIFLDWTPSQAALLGLNMSSLVASTPSLMASSPALFDACFHDASPYAVQSFLNATQWYQVFLGNNGAKLFNYRRPFPAGMYVAHVVGDRVWHVCSPDSAGWVSDVQNLMDPDYEMYPLLHKASCWEGTAKEGDVLYIPPGWFHEQLVVSPVSVAVVGATLGAYNRRAMTQMLTDCCSDPTACPLPAPFTPTLCTLLVDTCIPWWNAALVGNGRGFTPKRGPDECALHV